MPVGLKILGNTGEKIPEVGLGTWNYEGNAEALVGGLKTGARFIDTAEGYGTEAVCGEAVRQSGEEVFIATKVSGRHLGYDDVLRAAEASLKRMGTDVIDLYQIHWPNAAFPIRRTMEAMQKLVDSAVVRFVGLSNFSIAELREAQKFLPNSPIVSNQVVFNLNRREIETGLLPFCASNKVTVIAYTPLDSGRLCGMQNGGAGSKRYETLKNIALETGRTEAQVALNWCLCFENVVVIPKSSSERRNVENCGSSGWRLGAEHFERLCSAFV